jgi:two-component system, OmpR family, response regulator RegX3
VPPEHAAVRVLVVEDEESYRQALASGLRREGFEVVLAEDGPEGIRRFEEHRPDIVLLDMLLPGMHGIDVCRRLRAVSDVPILMVSAVDSELDVVLGLELGASGYVTKPFRLRELVARMHAILRRVSPRGLGPLPLAPPAGSDGPARVHAVRSPTTDGDTTAERVTRFGSVHVDYVRREVTVGGTPVHLSRKEFDLLAVLLHPAQRVRSRDELIELLWPDTYLTDTRTLDTHIHRLRSKLEPEPTEPRYIVTVRGVGFRIDPDGTFEPPPAGNRDADEPVTA